MAAGLHDPDIPSSDVAGKDGAVELWHTGLIWLNRGVTGLTTFIVIVLTLAH